MMFFGEKNDINSGAFVDKNTGLRVNLTKISYVFIFRNISKGRNSMNNYENIVKAK